MLRLAVSKIVCAPLLPRDFALKMNLSTFIKIVTPKKSHYFEPFPQHYGNNFVPFLSVLTCIVVSNIILTF